MSHDGAVDDLIALALVAVSREVDLCGVSLVDGDCLAEPTLAAQAKLLRLAGREDLTCSLSASQPVNAFPMEYRGDCVRFLELARIAAIDAQPPAPPCPNGERHLAEVLRAASESSITLLATGPLTPVQLVLEAEPALESKLERIVWMGGAIDVPGNLDPATLPAAAVNPFAEWNAYWDPPAVARLWETGIPITVCPLDLTDRVPVTPEFLLRLSRERRHPLYDFAGQCYALVAHQAYFFWDVLTTAYLGRPDLFEYKPRATAVITEGPGQGRITIEAGGREVEVLVDVDLDEFYRYILQQWAR